MGDARVQIDELLSGAPEDASRATTVDPMSSGARGRWPWMAALAVAAALIAAMAMPTLRHLRETPPAQAPEMRVDIATPATDAPLEFALSPDGRSLVYVASGDGTSRLWLRPPDQAEARPLAGTEGAASPFWSPDSRSIAFFDATRLRPMAGGCSTTRSPRRAAAICGRWT